MSVRVCLIYMINNIQAVFYIIRGEARISWICGHPSSLSSFPFPYCSLQVAPITERVDSIRGSFTLGFSLTTDRHGAYTVLIKPLERSGQFTIEQMTRLIELIIGNLNYYLMEVINFHWSISAYPLSILVSIYTK